MLASPEAFHEVVGLANYIFFEKPWFYFRRILLFALFFFGRPRNWGGWPGLRWLIGSIAGVGCHGLPR